MTRQKTNRTSTQPANKADGAFDDYPGPGFDKEGFLEPTATVGLRKQGAGVQADKEFSAADTAKLKQGLEEIYHACHHRIERDGYDNGDNSSRGLALDGLEGENPENMLNYLNRIVEGCEWRLRKGNDRGDQQTLATALGVLRELGQPNLRPSTIHADDLFHPATLREARNQGPASRQTLVHLHPNTFLGLVPAASHNDRLVERANLNLLRDAVETGVLLRHLPRLIIDRNPEGHWEVAGREDFHLTHLIDEMGFASMPVVIEASEASGVRWGETAIRPKEIMPKGGRNPQWDSYEFPEIETFTDGPTRGLFNGETGPLRGLPLLVREAFEKAGAHEEGGRLVLEAGLDLEGIEAVRGLPDNIHAKSYVNLDRCYNLEALPCNLQVDKDLRLNFCHKLDFSHGFPEGFKVNFLTGTNGGRTGSRVIVYMGAEDLLRTGSFEHFTVETKNGDRKQRLGTCLTKREAWEFRKLKAAEGVQGLRIGMEHGGEDGTDSYYEGQIVWPSEAAGEGL